MKKEKKEANLIDDATIDEKFGCFAQLDRFIYVLESCAHVAHLKANDGTSLVDRRKVMSYFQRFAQLIPCALKFAVYLIQIGQIDVSVQIVWIS